MLHNIFVPMAYPNSLALHVPLHLSNRPECQPCLNTFTRTHYLWLLLVYIKVLPKLVALVKCEMCILLFKCNEELTHKKKSILAVHLTANELKQLKNKEFHNGREL